VSLVDDLGEVRPSVRLLCHGIAALGAICSLASMRDVSFAGDIAANLVLLVAITWMTNLYNFMDGADGLAGGMAVVGFATLAFALACGAVASASAGFLLHNFPPARVFLGDSGAVPLGFLAAVLGAYGVIDGTWPAWFPMLVFSLFIVDATTTLLRRLARRERI